MTIAGIKKKNEREDLSFAVKSDKEKEVDDKKFMLGLV